MFEVVGALKFKRVVVRACVFLLAVSQLFCLYCSLLSLFLAYLFYLLSYLFRGDFKRKVEITLVERWL